MASLEYAIGAIAGIVEAVVTLPSLAAANSLSLNVIEYGGKFYQVSPSRELSWIESHMVLPLVNTKLLGVLPATTMIWLLSISLCAASGFYVARHLTKRCTPAAQAGTR